jgi:hypothetical protein
MRRCKWSGLVLVLVARARDPDVFLVRGSPTPRGSSDCARRAWRLRLYKIAVRRMRAAFFDPLAFTNRSSNATATSATTSIAPARGCGAGCARIADIASAGRRPFGSIAESSQRMSHIAPDYRETTVVKKLSGLWFWWERVSGGLRSNDIMAQQTQSSGSPPRRDDRTQPLCDHRRVETKFGLGVSSVGAGDRLQRCALRSAARL